MTRLAYFDLASGASGDMTIAALADAGRRLGVDVQGVIADAVASLDLGCAVTFIDDERGGLACLRAEVKTGDATHTPSELKAALDRADVHPVARRRAMRGLDAVVQAEGVVHGTSVDDVHLHELGSADTAVDLIGAAAGLHTLDVTTVTAAPVPMPVGHVASAHGRLPLPAPVTLELLAGATVRGVDASTELVTPTGAAILIAHEAAFGPLPEMILQATGVGGGTRDTEQPNICRVLIGSPAGSAANVEAVVLLEANIDDQTPESLGHAVETIIRSGALDAWITQILMKKTRPAFLLSVLARPSDEPQIVEAVFRHTTTLGLRRRETTRWTLDRSELYVRVDGYDVRVKVATLGDEIVNLAPEFGDCADVADRTGRSVDDVYEQAKTLATRISADTPD
ncbi:MAG: nickel pincer cofactor biosynthesis protein LarC [Actinomycetota bacterium]